MTDATDGGMGGMDMNALMAQAQEMASKLMAGQEAAAETLVEGVAGGGAVRIEMTGAGEFTNVSIAKEAVDPDDVEMLEDLVLAALNDAQAQAAEMQPGIEGMGDLGGLDLGGLLGGGSS